MSQPVTGFFSPQPGVSNASGIRGIGPQADFFTLSGEQSPGLATLTGCNAAQAWDIRRGYGLMWATIVPSGEELSKLVFKVDLWTAGHSKAWDQFAAKYLSRPAPATPGTTSAKSYGFTHDQASAPPYNVGAVVVLDVVYLGQTEAGMVSHEVHLLEWRPPKPTGPRPDQQTPAVEAGLPTATDKLGQEQNDATTEVLQLESVNAGLGTGGV